MLAVPRRGRRHCERCRFVGRRDVDRLPGGHPSAHRRRQRYSDRAPRGPSTSGGGLLNRTGTIAKRAHQHGARSAVGCPIRVRGRIWGAIGALRYEAETFPPGTETRMAEFADLVATAIANAAARTEVERLAEEQAALRRVATLVAQGASAPAVFDAVA